MTTMTTPSVTLTSYNMGDVTAFDFMAWADFVTENIDDACGFEVAVESYRFGESAARDYVSGATPEQEETIRHALRSMWDDFCGGAWDAAYTARAVRMVASVQAMVGSDGTVDLRTIVDHALQDDESVTAEAIAEIVREAREDAVAEGEDSDACEPAYRVMDYDTAAALKGGATADLIRESLAAGDTGAVPAAQFQDGVWDYVAPSERDHFRRLGYHVQTVYVEETC